MSVLKAGQVQVGLGISKLGENLKTIRRVLVLVRRYWYWERIPISGVHFDTEGIEHWVNLIEVMEQVVGRLEDDWSS